MESESPIVEKVENVVKTEAIQPVEEDAHREVQVISQAHTDMAITDSTWQVKEILQRPHFIMNVDWNTSMADGTEIVSMYLPTGLIRRCENSSLLTILDCFSFLNTAFELSLHCPGTNYHMGKLRMFMTPFDVDWCTNAQNAYNLNIVSMTGYPGVNVDASVAATGKLIIPHSTQGTFLSQKVVFKPRKEFGQLHISVYNKLATTDTSPNNLKCTLYMKMVNPLSLIPNHFNASNYTARVTNEVLARVRQSFMEQFPDGDV